MITQNERALENLNFLKEIFPGKLRITLDEYADMEGISRANAAKHLRQSGCVYHQKKKGGTMYVFLTDYADHLAHNKNRNSRAISWHGGMVHK